MGPPREVRGGPFGVGAPHRLTWRTGGRVVRTS